MLLALTLLCAPTVDDVEFPLEAGGVGVAQQATLEVPLVRSDPDSARVEVEYTRFPAEEPVEGRPPIFLLRGGPGFRGLAGTIKREGFYEQNLQALARIADVVVIGQRGIGSSKPDTICSSYVREDLARPVDLEERAGRQREGCRQCREKWEGKGYDLSGFNVLEAADDVIAVADHLGYDRLTLTGTSFGSHWAMALMRRHPDRIERALLGGIEGPDHTYDMPTYVLNAVRRFAAAADAAPELAEHVPEGGFLAAFERVVAQAEREPILVDEGLPILFDATRVAELALGVSSRASSRRGMRTWPQDVLALSEGRFEAAAHQLARRNFLPVLPTASYFNLDCGSGISAERRAELLADPAARLVGPLGAWYEATCPAWDADLGEDFRAGFTTDIPVVLVHGTWDTSTPFENAIECLPMFTSGHLVVVEGGSHGALGEARSASPEFQRAVEAFLAEGTTEDLPGLVELPPLDWVVPDR